MRILQRRKIVGHEEKLAVCVGCAVPVTPGFCYTGSIITGLRFTKVTSQERLPIKGVIEVYDQPPILIGGQIVDTHRTMGYFHRAKGFLCDSCSARCADTVTDRNGTRHQVAIVDSRPGFIGETARGTYIPSPQTSRSYRESSLGKRRVQR